MAIGKKTGGRAEVSDRVLLILLHRVEVEGLSLTAAARAMTDLDGVPMSKSAVAGLMHRFRAAAEQLADPSTFGVGRLPAGAKLRAIRVGADAADRPDNRDLPTYRRGWANHG